jgi:hypothetical protein
MSILSNETMILTRVLFVALLQASAVLGWLMPHGRPHQRNQHFRHPHIDGMSTSCSPVGSILRFSSNPSPSPTPIGSSLPDTSRPLPPHTFGGMVEQRLMLRFGEKAIERVLISWRLLDQEYYRKEYVGDDFSVDGQPPSGSDMIQECHSYLPGLSIRPFWNPGDFEWTKYLESHYLEIRREFDAVTRNIKLLQQEGNNIWAGALTEDAASYGEGWKTLVLMDRGRWDSVNANLFPKTACKLTGCVAKPTISCFFT